jgi:hypothetical protein
MLCCVFVDSKSGVFTTTSPLTLRYKMKMSKIWSPYSVNYIEVEVTLQLPVSQSACQGIVPTLGLVTRYYFLSEGCFLKFAVLSLWGALSDERSGSAICLSQSVVMYQYLHQAFTLHVFCSSTIYIQYIKFMSMPNLVKNSHFFPLL